MQNPDALADFWNTFLKATNRPPDTPYLEAFHFDITEASANGLLALVLAGTKRATASSLYYFERNHLPLPKPGDLSILTDWAGVPKCVIETTAVTVLPFKDMTYDICKREGEDDSLESWQNNHIHFFTEEGKAEGYSFSPDMPVVFEDFAVVYTP